MKNFERPWVAWNKAEFDAMERSRGPARGVAAVLVSSKLGNGYGTVIAGDSAASIAPSLPPSVGIYAILPSCNPQEIVSHMLSLWEVDGMEAEPFTMASDGLVFHQISLDALLMDIRDFAWKFYAEQNRVEIVELWGTKATP